MCMVSDRRFLNVLARDKECEHKVEKKMKQKCTTERIISETSAEQCVLYVHT